MVRPRVRNRSSVPDSSSVSRLYNGLARSLAGCITVVYTDSSFRTLTAVGAITSGGKSRLRSSQGQSIPDVAEYRESHDSNDYQAFTS